MTTAYNSTLPYDMIISVGTLTHDVSGSPVALGVTRGGLTFDAGTEWRNAEFDGKHSDIEGLDRVIKRTPVISGTFLQANEVVVPIFEAGSTAVTASSITTVTPRAAGSLLTGGAYLDNLTLTYPRALGGYVQIIFPKALVAKWSVKSVDSGEAEISCEFHARLSLTAAATSADAAPFTIKVG